jgi:DNA-binding response OmpR family regulator
MEKKILIVDDEPDILFALKLIFENHNYDVLTVENGEKAIKEIERGFRGVVLIDIMMPDLDGWDTLKEILKRGLIKNVAIDIITGKGTKNHAKMEGLESYINDYITKPFKIDQLINSVNECFKKLDIKKNR